MNASHCNTVRLLLTALAAGLIALIVVTLACGPTAPAGQDDGDATPSATATSTPTHTSTTTPTATSTPTPAPDPGKLDPVAQALLTLQTADAGDTVSGASGTTALTLPKTIRVSISTLSLDNTRSLLEANDGSIDDAETVVLANNWVVVGRVPISLLPALSRHSDTLYAYAEGPYHKMPGHLNQLVVEHAVAQLAGTASASSKPETMTMDIQVTAEGYTNVRRFCKPTTCL